MRPRDHRIATLVAPILARLSLAEDRVTAQEALLRVHPGPMRRAMSGLRWSGPC